MSTTERDVEAQGLPVVDSRLYRHAPALWHWEETDSLRDQHRFYWNQTVGENGHWVFTRFDDVWDAYHDPELFSNESIIASDPNPGYRFLPSHLDGEEHKKYRRLLTARFSPASIRAIRPELERRAEEIIRGLLDEGRCDFMSVYVDAFPVKAFLLCIGMEDADADFFVSRVRRISGVLSDPNVDKTDVLAAWGEISDYWSDQIARRRAGREGEPDLLDELLESEVDGQPLSDEDVLDLIVTLTFGGLDTTKSQMGWTMWHLAAHPEHRQAMLDDPALVDDVVEETLRLYPIISMGRKVTRDAEFAGCPMRKGDMAQLSIQSANRDPEVFPDPLEFKFGREGRRHLTFGVSAHHCLGAHLARAELQVTVAKWHELIPHYEIDAEEPLTARGGQIALLELPLKW